MKRRILKALAAAVCAAAALAGCSGLTGPEKAMVGAYYLTALSDTRPVIELRSDGTALLRAIRPGELSYSVGGRWSCPRGDTLVVVTDASTLEIEQGDPSLVGTIAERVAYPVVEVNASQMKLRRQGIEYDYRRRPLQESR